MMSLAMRKSNNHRGFIPVSQNRPIGSYDRRPGDLSPRQCILIVCEGKVTEPLYFEGLRTHQRLTTVEVEIEGKGEAPISVVDHAIVSRNIRIKEIRNHTTRRPNYDEVWCVFDVENLNDNPSFTQAIDKANQNHLHLAISNPCFEYWYLLHFVYTSRPYRDASELISDLHIQFPEYEKNKNIFPTLVDNTKIAIRRAHRVLTSGQADRGGRYPNPSTDVYLLVQKLMNFDQL
jgi:hypothetical protein